FIRMAVAFFMMPFIVGKLGDDWYGIWVLVGSIGGYFYLADFGLASAVSRYVAYHLAREEKEETNTVINTSLGIYCLMGLAIVALTVLLALVAGYFVADIGKLKIVRMVLLITGIQMALQFPFKAFVGIIQAKIRYDLLTASRLVTLALGASAIWFFLSRGYGVVALAWIGFATSQLSSILYFLIVRYLYQDLMVGFSFFSRGKVRELFGYSLWSFVIQIANQLRFKIDSVVLAALISMVHVTHYFIGARLVEYFTDLLYRATNMINPIFTMYHARKEREELRKKLLFMNRINLILAMFGSGLIILLGDSFIKLWMGEKYSDAYPVLVVLVSANAINFLMNPSITVLYAMARHSYLAKVSLGEGLANLFLSILLIRKFGILGCAFGTAIPLVVTRLIFIPVYVGRAVEVSVLKFYTNMAPTALFTIGYILLYAQISSRIQGTSSYAALVLLVAAACPLYLLVIYFLSFNREERGILLSFLPARIITTVNAKRSLAE
ncbi:MAG: oligosaccharide flippase family protein, partial [Deltaproteobacteria bacterium]